MKAKSEDRQGGNWALRLLVGAGFIALAYYFSWWFVDGRLRSPVLVIFFVFALLYSGTQLAGNWILYLAARKAEEPPQPPENLSVDVFVTACKESFGMIEKTLAAACQMRGAHKTWLLDDGSDPVLERLAIHLGAGYLTREAHKDAKAGNVNAALRKTKGDVIAIFDIDHVPAPDFLEKSLGYFSDPGVGFVQVMLTFANGGESWVAQAALETSLEFYNPTSLGTDMVGGATMMGSNALIRRSALESIGGYQPGLAEDLATSVALHAAGWRSAYVREPLAPGLAPPSFTAWFTQQLKWARGVFELLLTVFPREFKNLSWGQRLSYAVRMTKYWIGPAVALHLFATIVILIFGDASTRTAFHQYLIQITPLAATDVLIRFTALRLWRHPSTPRTSLLRAVALVYSTWPIYLMAWLMATFRLPLAFRPTPKMRSGKLNPVWLLPQVLALLTLTAGTLYTVIIGGHRPSSLLVFATLQVLLQMILFGQWLRTDLEVSDRMARSFQALKEITRPRAEVLKEIGNLTWALPHKNGTGNGHSPVSAQPSKTSNGIFASQPQYCQIFQKSLAYFDAISGSMLLFDEHGELREATVAYKGNMQNVPLDTLMEMVQRGLAGWVLQNRAAALVPDTLTEPRWVRRAWDDGGGSRSALSVPLISLDRVVGVLTLAHPGHGHFSNEDLSSLLEISGQAYQEAGRGIGR